MCFEQINVSPMKTFLILILSCCFALSHAQVGIGTTSPNEKALLDLTSESKGLLIPRMTWEQRMGMMLSPADAGMVVYQTNLPTPPNNFIRGLYYYKWQFLDCPDQQWIKCGPNIMVEWKDMGGHQQFV